MHSMASIQIFHKNIGMHPRVQHSGFLKLATLGDSPYFSLSRSQFSHLGFSGMLFQTLFSFPPPRENVFTCGIGLKSISDGLILPFTGKRTLTELHTWNNIFWSVVLLKITQELQDEILGKHFCSAVSIHYSLSSYEYSLSLNIRGVTVSSICDL